MKTWLQKIIFFLKRKQISRMKILEAYLLRDSKYLQKAYIYGENYFQRLAVLKLGELRTQKNFNFLMSEIVLTKDQNLKPHIYSAITNIAKGKKIQISIKEAAYIKQNKYLLKQVAEPTQVFMKTTSPFYYERAPKDALGKLEDMKKDFELY